MLTNVVPDEHMSGTTLANQHNNYAAQRSLLTTRKYLIIIEVALECEVFSVFRVYDY